MTSEATARVETLTWARLDRVTEMIVEAFFDDPLLEWIFEDPASRRKQSAHLFRVLIEYGIRYGRPTQLSDGQAAAIWLPPGQRVGMAGMVRCGFLGVPFRIGLGRFSKFGGAQEQMDAIHARVLTAPHWYLLGLGVDPERQGQGLGSELVRAGTALADEAGAPCYLETSRPRNLDFYRRHGFEVAEETTLGRDGPPAWGMVRPPR